ncbi:MAG: M16 family metallopeptidase [Solirubrobacteraceae bacterium]|nr:MAG: peptidase M16 [Solirubrobacterales bacterium]
MITEAMPSVRSVTLGFWIGTGSRGESAEQAGLSHLIEHMLFRGSERLTSLQIDEAFDEMGAEINAGTGKETTSVYARVLDRHLERAVEIVSEMVWRPVMRDVDAEREIILEEIAMYEDDPQDKVFDILGEAIFGSHPLGRAIVGRAEVVRETPVEAIAAFHSARYHPRNVVIAAAGSVDHDELVALAERFGPRARRGSEVPTTAPAPQRSVRFETKETEQFHVCLGGPGLARDDERRFALRVLDNVVGATGSSRLFQEVREKRGLAYSVYSFLAHHEGTGQVGLYLGTRPENLAAALRVVGDELARLQRDPASAEELHRAKENVKGRTVLALESTAARMNRLGSSLLSGVPLYSLDQLVERIDAVTREDLASLVEELWEPVSLSVAGIGSDEARFDLALAPFGGNREARAA